MMVFTFFSQRHLDISFNTIKKIEQISQLQNLTEIYLCQNKIKKVGDELRYLTSLTTLELGSNRLRVSRQHLFLTQWIPYICSMQVLENIETLTNLRNLWLGRNKLHELRVSSPTQQPLSWTSLSHSFTSGFRELKAT